MDSFDERKTSISERVRLAQQGAAENAQFSIAIAVGIFAILTMFLMINHHSILNSLDDKEEHLGLGNSFWNKGSWTFAEGTILSIAYWALVLFGLQSYISRRLFEGLIGYYVKDMYEDITRIAAENKLANWMVKRIWASNDEKNDRYKHLIPVIILYFSITFFLWFFVALF
jgi:hypothetical protein